MSEVKFSNFARTTVANTTLSAAATSVTLTAVTGMPTIAAGNWTYLVLTRLSDNATEIVKCTAIDTTTKVATIARAQGGTTAKAFVLGDRIENWVVADILSDLRSQWQAEIQAALTNTITRGSVVVGGVSDVPTELVGKTAGKVLIGDGTDIKSLAISGDATLAGTGALTIAANAITTAKILNNNVTLAKLVAASAQGKLLGRSTAASGNWEEVATDGVGLEFPAGGALQLKDVGVVTAKLADEAVTSAKMSSSVLKVATITIPYADVRTLYATPYTLIAAPGAGYCIVPHLASVVLDYGGVGYGNYPLQGRYTDASGAQCLANLTSFISYTEDYIGWMYPTSGCGAASGITNAPLMLCTTGSLGSSGTSPLRVTVWYSVVTTGL